jgi:ferredoxin
LEAAGRAGIRVSTGCERGLCRACVTPKLSGATQLEADGRPLDRITVCNSLACSDIDLDL